MNKILVIGCPGSGKSTFARRLRDASGLPLYYLDMIYHLPDKTVVSKEVFDRRLDEILRCERWIIDGNYSRTMSKRLEFADTVFFLDLPLDECLKGLEQRIGKAREDMPWVEDEKSEDYREFVEYVSNFRKEHTPEINAKLSHFRGEIIRFNSRSQVDDYCKKLLEE